MLPLDVEMLLSPTVSAQPIDAAFCTLAALNVALPMRVDACCLTTTLTAVILPPTVLHTPAYFVLNMAYFRIH